jgi:hypothetical protein
MTTKLDGSSAGHYLQKIQRNRNGQEKEEDELNNTVK